MQCGSLSWGIHTIIDTVLYSHSITACITLSAIPQARLIAGLAIVLVGMRVPCAYACILALLRIAKNGIFRSAACLS